MTPPKFSRVETLERSHIARFSRKHGLRLVALFGSSTRSGGQPRDLDLAVWPATESTVEPLALARELAAELGRGDLDIAWLPTGTWLLWQEVAREGRLLFESEPGQFGAFRREATLRSWDAEVWRRRNRAFVRRVLEGSLQVNRDLLEQELASLADYQGKLQEVLQISEEDFVVSYRDYHLAERLLELMIECAGRINNEIGQAVGGTPSSDYYSSFFAVAAARWISPELARNLAQLALLRNALVHRYESTSAEKTYRELLDSLALWRQYMQALSSKLSGPLA